MDNFLNNHWWHLRLTTDIQETTIIKLIKNFSNTYLICNEINHYHCLYKTQTKESEMRKIIKSMELNGNGKYSLAYVRNLKQMKKYILKDGHYKQNNFNQQELETLQKMSFKKGLDKFSEQQQELEEKYMSSNITFTQFGENFIELKASYNQNLYGNHIKAYLDKIRCKKEGKDFSRLFFSRMYRFD